MLLLAMTVARAVVLLQVCVHGLRALRPEQACMELRIRHSAIHWHDLLVIQTCRPFFLVWL